MTWRPTWPWRTGAEPQPHQQQQPNQHQQQHAVPTRDKVLMAQAWLTVLDGLEGTLGEAGGRLEADPSDAGGRYRSARVLDGVRVIHEQALDMMTALGYRRHDETGIPFDPGLHEVVRVEPDAQAAAGIVVEVLRPGYGDGERQLRPAAVVVAGGNPT
jgi:molecular chaperone GrpE